MNEVPAHFCLPWPLCRPQICSREVQNRRKLVAESLVVVDLQIAIIQQWF